VVLLVSYAIVNALKRHNQAFELDDKIKHFSPIDDPCDFETPKEFSHQHRQSYKGFTQAAFDLTEQLRLRLIPVLLIMVGSIQSLIAAIALCRAGRGVVLAYVLLRQGSNLFGRLT